MDGSWIGPVVDHLCSLLTKYGIAADQELLTSKAARDIIGQDEKLESKN